MIIDVHVHYHQEPDYLDRLIAQCDALGITKICMSGMGVATTSERFKLHNNDGIREAMTRYPERIIGMGFVRLGLDGPDKVDTLWEHGFRGLKVVYPAANYDDKSFYPIYARAEDLSMPTVFHTGIASRRDVERSFDVASSRMRPIYLDTIARAFPSLTLIAYHFGNPWYEEAAEVVRWNPNVYFDLSGSTLKKKSTSFFRELLWWEGSERYKGPGGFGPYDKMLFGSDVVYWHLPEVLADYRKLFDELGLSDQKRQSILFDNAARIFGVE